MYLYVLLYSIFAVATANSSSSSSSSPLSSASSAATTLQTWYNAETGLWDTCGWWNGANCMTALADLAMLVDESDPLRQTAEEVFNTTFVVAPSVNPDPGLEKVTVNGRPETRYPAAWPLRTHDIQESGTVNASAWLDGAYDDDGWWALAWIAAYDLTGVQDYLELAIGIFDEMTTVWPTNCGDGGIYWDHTRSYVNAISNELFFSVAAHLANRASNPADYLDWAQREWAWFQASGMINAQGTINDGLTADCKNNQQTVWSYNQGVVLGGLVELNRAAPNASYIEAATRIAKAAITALADSNKVIHESCEPNNCDANQTQFKGIFLRNLQMLQAVAPDDQFAAVIRACADSIWANDRNDANQLGVDWAGPVTKVDASTQSSALDALVAAVAIA
ncbi:hypothetical protein ASPZODRAFT_55438 [Penicilliopsis zonata CBS 506.65]|uniref:mannan endo-1,6-alpha-mannosidase n=1 Tax=Penicilliopsis zonata CBS 506.65 TaxID=1073090 RepID=A0A1L9SX75_9EURO|nr:hypothetical protein ASPZODRAFT_55438 [Penicilliopsis zonata CBS 506.65]OJJ51795.1 hypothetical protein ASPZODRAFT_55438 [Penicilliopsis zonata CBS 506.65]